jgi:hypothetical protein
MSLVEVHEPKRDAQRVLLAQKSATQSTASVIRLREIRFCMMAVAEPLKARRRDVLDLSWHPAV